MKKLKKFLSSFIPKGIFKERLKCAVYNIVRREVRFGVLDNPLRYTTKYNDLNLVTKNPLYTRANEFDVYQKFYQVKPGDAVVDAGANTGYTSVFFSKLVGSRGKVYAFEPDAINIALIGENLAFNPDSDNITVEDLLLWNENTFVDFYESGTVASSALWLPESENIVKKETITLDDWVRKNNIPKIDFVKMNIEGAEVEAIRGCKETIARFRPDFAIYSNHLAHGKMTYISLEAFFGSIGYPYKTIFNGAEIVTYAGESHR